MAQNVSSLVSTFERLWPLSGAEEWDRPGLAIGNPKAEVSRVLLAVDVTKSVLQEALSTGSQLVLAHHPLLLKGESYLAEDRLKGNLVSFAVQNQIAVYTAHTNADIVENGVSDVLAKELDLKEARPLVPISSDAGHGRIGSLASAMPLGELAKLVSRMLPPTNAPVRVAGDTKADVSVVAVVGGAGDSFISAAQQAGAQVLITSDLRHHVTLDAATDPSKPVALIDVSHFAAESLWLSVAASQLAKLHPHVEFIVSEVITDPWSMTLGGLSES